MFVLNYNPDISKRTKQYLIPSDFIKGWPGLPWQDTPSYRFQNTAWDL
jgi:hypothetical protein